MSDFVFCVLSVGSNLGDREENLRAAADAVKENVHIRDFRTASIYETEPVGYTEQPYFLNTCFAFETDLSPYGLLDFIQGIENEMHRVRDIRFGPRTIDLDILIYGNKCINDERLIVPHPRMYERAFVLIPFSELTGYSGNIPEDKSVKKLYP